MAVTAVVGLLVAVGVAHDHYFWERAWRDTPPSDVRLAMARSIDAHTLPGERVAVVGFGWSPEVLYYARRKGITFTDAVTTATTLAAIDGSYRLLAVSPSVPPSLPCGGARPLAVRPRGRAGHVPRGRAEVVTSAT